MIEHRQDPARQENGGQMELQKTYYIPESRSLHKKLRLIWSCKLLCAIQREGTDFGEYNFGQSIFGQSISGSFVSWPEGGAQTQKNRAPRVGPRRVGGPKFRVPLILPLRRGRRGFTRQPENPTRANFEGPVLQKHNQNSTRRYQREKKSEILGGPVDGPGKGG